MLNIHAGDSTRCYSGMGLPAAQYYLTSTSAAILFSASSVVLIIPSFAKPLPKIGMPDISTFQNTSICVALELDDEGLSVSVLVPVTGPWVIFVSTTDFSGFTVTN
jgi:hypothetical protein